MALAATGGAGHRVGPLALLAIATTTSWGVGLLSPEASPLRLATENAAQRCYPGCVVGCAYVCVCARGDWGRSAKESNVLISCGSNIDLWFFVTARAGGGGGGDKSGGGSASRYVSSVSCGGQISNDLASWPGVAVRGGSWTRLHRNRTLASAARRRAPSANSRRGETWADISHAVGPAPLPARQRRFF